MNTHSPKPLSDGLVTKRTKADLIRTYISDNPEMRPTDIARKIADEHPGIKISPQEVSTIKKRLTPLPSDSSLPANFVEAVHYLKKAKDILGKEQCKRLLDLLQSVIWIGFTVSSLFRHLFDLSPNL